MSQVLERPEKIHDPGGERVVTQLETDETQLERDKTRVARVETQLERVETQMEPDVGHVKYDDAVNRRRGQRCCTICGQT